MNLTETARVQARWTNSLVWKALRGDAFCGVQLREEHALTLEGRPEAPATGVHGTRGDVLLGSVPEVEGGSPSCTEAPSPASISPLDPHSPDGKFSQASATTAVPSEGGTTLERDCCWEDLVQELFRLYCDLDGAQARELVCGLAVQLAAEGSLGPTDARGDRFDDLCSQFLEGDRMQYCQFRENLTGLFADVSLDVPAQTTVLHRLLRQFEEPGAPEPQAQAKSARKLSRAAKQALEAAMCWVLDLRLNQQKPGSHPLEEAKISRQEEERGEKLPGGLADSLPPWVAEVRRWANQPKKREGYEFGDLFVKAIVRNAFTDVDAAAAPSSVPDGLDPTAATLCTGRRPAAASSVQPCTGGASLMLGIGSSCGPPTELNVEEVAETETEIEKLMRQLFKLQDLNSNGSLEELELIQLNKKIAVLHSGHGVDKAALATKYRDLFRERLDATGSPVPYAKFRGYMIEVLAEMEPRDGRAQQMILEQFIAEADVARRLFRAPSLESESDEPFLSSLPPPEEGTVVRVQAEPAPEPLPAAAAPAPPTRAVPEQLQPEGSGTSVLDPCKSTIVGRPWPREPMWHEVW